MSVDTTLQALLQHSGLARWMRPDALAGLVKSLAPVVLSEGEILCSAGDPADGAWLVTSGTLEVLSPDGVHLAEEGPGALVGEQALMPGGLGRRNATLRARAPCRLLAIDAATFARLLEAHRAEIERLSASRRRNHLSRSVESFRRLLEGAEERAWEEGAFVFREGDEADGLYIVLSGRASVVTAREGDPVVLAELFPGQVFGEIGVLKGAARTASVIARGGLRAAFIPADRVRDRFRDDGGAESALQNLVRSRELPHQGHSQQHAIAIDGELCIQTVFALDDGRELVGIREPSGRYTLTQTGAEVAETATIAASTRVDLDADGRIIGFSDDGTFEDVGGLQLLALDGSPLSQAQRRAVKKAAKAAEAFAPKSQICRCLNVDRQTIVACIEDGATTVKAIQTATGAGTGCGGCLRRVAPILAGTEAPAPTLRLGPPASQAPTHGTSFLGWLRSALGR